MEDKLKDLDSRKFQESLKDFKQSVDEEDDLLKEWKKIQESRERENDCIKHYSSVYYNN